MEEVEAEVAKAMDGGEGDDGEDRSEEADEEKPADAATGGMWAELKAFAKSVLPSTIKDAIDSEEIAATSKHDKDFLQVEVKVQVSCIEFLNNMHV